MSESTFVTHSEDCMSWEWQPAGDDGWHDCTCHIFNSPPTHDPLCPNAKGCSHDCGDCLCLADTFCQCELIAKVRDEERWATVESAVFVASQYGADPELVQHLSRMYETPSR